jgi:cytochrome c556
MKMRTSLVAGVIGIVLTGFGAGCGESAPPAPPFKQVTDTAQLMEWVMDPAADIVWGSVGTVMDADGTREIVPTTDEEWDAVRNAAIMVAESGNLLMMPAHAKDQDDWMEYAAGLVDISLQVAKAAQDHSRDGIFDKGGELYAVCSSCHQMYIKEIREGIPQ